jgi:molybdenum cofactor cytidylyltransferase
MARVRTDYHAIVLGAGSGRRFGGRKLLAPFEGAPLLFWSLRAAFAAPVQAVTLATGADHEEVEALALRYAAQAGEQERLRIVHVRHHAEGMAASLRAAIASMPEKLRGCFIFLGDMPCVPPGIGEQLLFALARSQALAAAPAHNGQRGHPVLVRARLFPPLGKLAGDAGAGRLLNQLGPDLVLLPTDDPGVLFDVDVPLDLRRRVTSEPF